MNTLNAAGAEILASRIRAYWATEGLYPKLTISKVTYDRDDRGLDFSGIYQIRSDMCNGLPWDNRPRNSLWELSPSSIRVSISRF